jgi:hypothetical protein
MSSTYFNLHGMSDLRVTFKRKCEKELRYNAYQIQVFVRAKPLQESPPESAHMKAAGLASNHTARLLYTTERRRVGRLI